eukprot:CAMPEP_0202965278 /NCGR_PEP_ID=MMETSP1396-20130829/9310_1 /ASSEMBLY_ACC=CAM_ASM_000872 /TAXON_ID= /ORGANISM="Pseudokeronopsis sp., Strain Brazil" /LENGTH=114 /DNA_ID=CAMNT_0049687947 /DNA_START=279 /DNA_END=624 /DNA_ORIENTATION=-
MGCAGEEVHKGPGQGAKRECSVQRDESLKRPQNRELELAKKRIFGFGELEDEEGVEKPFDLSVLLEQADKELEKEAQMLKLRPRIDSPMKRTPTKHWVKATPPTSSSLKGSAIK